jgi:hypothetical protein
MSSLADLPEIIGFFSYSREDDEDSENGLSALRTRIQNELRAQLGCSKDALRLWQDREAIPPGTLWESQIDNAVKQAVFFIPIVTPRVLRSEYCGIEFQKFLDRERELKRSDLIFPILYIDVEELENPKAWRHRPEFRMMAERQYVDWRNFRYDLNSPDVRRAVASLCRTIAQALRRTIPDEQVEPPVKVQPDPLQPASIVIPSQEPTEETVQLPSGPERKIISEVESGRTDVQAREGAQASVPTAKDGKFGATRGRFRGPWAWLGSRRGNGSKPQHGGEPIESPAAYLPATAPAEDILPPTGGASVSPNPSRSRRFAMLFASAVAIAVLGPLTYAAFVEITNWKVSPSNSVQTSSPAAAPVGPASCADILCGTTWKLDQGPNDSSTLVFSPNNWVSYYGKQNHYTLYGTSLTFSVNNNYAEYRGTVQGSRMNGTAKNVNNFSWSWSAVKQ